MRTLVIDCATEACSLALFDGAALVDHRHDLLGRGHAERLVPLIASLPGKGRADRILVSLGPGSFTGVRIGLAAARALGVAWGAEVLGYPTLALVAAQARDGADRAVTICMNGGHGEWFVQDFGPDGLPGDEVVSLRPEAAAGRKVHSLVAGNRASELAERLSSPPEVLALLPDARHALALPPALLLRELGPIYGRGPDAKLPA